MLQDYQLKSEFIVGVVVYAIKHNLSTEEMVNKFCNWQVYNEFADKYRRLENAD